MKTKRNNKETGNVLICVLGAILILSLIGANVMQSSATRLNASVNHVRAWKESLSAAETGGDVAFAEIRSHKTSQPSTWPWTGWTQSVNGSRYTYTSPVTTFGSSNLQAQTVIDECYFDNASGLLVAARPGPNANTWFRMRSKGTAPLPGLKRAGMDDALMKDDTKHFADFGSTEMQDITARGKGDSLLRKIDFDVDHFVATYGAEGDGLNKAIVPPTSAPSISRRIEQLVQPQTPFFDAAIKANGSFYGLGSASFIDSYDSRHNSPYDSGIKDNPSHPWFDDSRHGSVQINNATASVKGSIYGDVATNGGNVTSGNPGIVYGTIDNNVPFTLEPFDLPNIANPQSINVTGDTTITPPAAGTLQAPNYYDIGTTMNRTLTLTPAIVNGNPVETWIAVRIRGDVGSPSGSGAGFVVSPKVHVRVYFERNFYAKAVNLQNASYLIDGASSYPLSGPFAGNLQFYGVSHPEVGPQRVELDSGGGQTGLAFTIYAPTHDVQFNGAPDFFGTVTAKTFYANGNITWHYDRALNDTGEVLDYKIASYIEDTR